MGFHTKYDAILEHLKELEISLFSDVGEYLKIGYTTLGLSQNIKQRRRQIDEIYKEIYALKKELLEK